MNSYAGNGMSSELAMFETPFADISTLKEATRSNEPAEVAYSNFLHELESPFTRTYEVAGNSAVVTQVAEEFVQFLGELNDAEFSDSLYELASEMEDRWLPKISNEAAMGDHYVPFATQQAREFITPLLMETETMIDKVAQHFSGNNLSDYNEKEIETFFSELEFSDNNFSPAQEQFFGKIINKVKSVVKKGVDLAKKGINAVGKILPVNIILNKIKGLIKPLLDKVLKFAIGKLPKNLQPHAQTLAKKFLKLEAPAAPESTELFSSGEIDGIQTEFDTTVAQLLFTADEVEGNSIVSEYEFSDEVIERELAYEAGGITPPSLESARQQFINELKSLPPGESPAPAIERFLPAAILALQPVIKVAISVIGRQKVINFLAGLLAKLVGKYVPENVAKPLAASIIDVGMSAIGFEVNETNKSDIGYEAIANVIQETVQHIAELNEATIQDQEALTLQLLEAFETAAANNFPPQYIKEQLRPSIQPGVWVLKPRKGPKHMYKKFTKVFNITIDPQSAQAIKSFRDLPLANFLKDKLSLDPSKPIQAKVHLFETIPGTKLSKISKFENIPGFNAQQPFAWVQLHPLTKQAAAILLKEPALGKDISQKSNAKRHRTGVGQRFYYLEISGARLRIPAVNRGATKAGKPGKMRAPKPSQSGDIQGVINFVKSEISFSYYFSEEDAKSVVEKINKNDFLGAAISIRHAIKNVLNGMLSKNVSNKVKIIHEAIPELYLEHIGDHEQESALASLAKTAGGIVLGGSKEMLTKLIEQLVEKISEHAYQAVANFFKGRAAEFKEAQAQPQDGVTIKISWSNIQGMTAIRTVINAIRNKNPLGNISELTLPNIPSPEIKIVADKKFD
ncbi:hypothetical protein [Chryseolinea sp. H1M3-3]|uniref:hypothetical protein n=1 Tax=Chryseolinea sp. H1M3-3 TaxID=3034144 RepID=UPI0023EA9066|nr:hypothetical protein [Chryseolinea sp. H1M3-3]